MNLDIATLINIGCIVVSIAFFIARLDSTTKANQKFYMKCIEDLHVNIQTKFEFLDANMMEKFNGMDEKFHNIKADISRLEHKQEESNKIKERLAIVEYALKDMSHKMETNSINRAYERAYNIDNHEERK